MHTVFVAWASRPARDFQLGKEATKVLPSTHVSIYGTKVVHNIYFLALRVVKVLHKSVE